MSLAFVHVCDFPLHFERDVFGACERVEHVWQDVGGFQRIQRLPGELDPIFARCDVLAVAGGVGEFHLIDEVDFGVWLAVLLERIFNDSHEASDCDFASGLLLHFADKRLATGFAKLNVAARQI